MRQKPCSEENDDELTLATIPRAISHARFQVVAYLTRVKYSADLLLTSKHKETSEIFLVAFNQFPKSQHQGLTNRKPKSLEKKSTHA